MDLQIRRSTPEDLEKIIMLQALAFRYLSPSYNLAQIDSLVRDQALARSRFARNETTIVAECENTFVGFASLMIYESQIGGVYVHPSFVRRGIGTALLKSVEKMAMDEGLRVIHVTSSLDAVSFYQKNDYETMRQSGIYSENIFWIPCVNLKKQLPTPIERKNIRSRKSFSYNLKTVLLIVFVGILAATLAVMLLEWIHILWIVIFW